MRLDLKLSWLLAGSVAKALVTRKSHWRWSWKDIKSKVWRSLNCRLQSGCSIVRSCLSLCDDRWELVGDSSFGFDRDGGWERESCSDAATDDYGTGDFPFFSSKDQYCAAARDWDDLGNNGNAFAFALQQQPGRVFPIGNIEGEEGWGRS